MLGLIKKDLLMIKSNLKLIGIMCFVFLILALQGEFDLSFMPAFISVMLFISTVSYDEYNKWYAYATTLPNGKKNIVKSKYIATLILVFASILLTIILNIIIGILKNNLDLEKIISLMSGGLLGVIFIEALVYPLIFKYGIEKGRIGLFISTFGIVAIIGLLSKVIKIKIPTNIISFIEHYWLIIFPILMITMLYISYKISKKIISKKEF